ncbi:MAG: hypothetical protein ABH844_01480 [Candidatus Omnitrophota bacterium]
MDNYCKKAVDVIKHLAEIGGLKFEADDLTLLEQHSNALKDNSDRIMEIRDATFKGFFKCATIGEALYPEQRIIEKFGNSITDNYPEASQTFLKFAKTYWTLKVLIYDVMEKNIDWIGGRLLCELEKIIGPLFFPFSGPHKISPDRREETQRKFLAEFAPDINVEEFMRGNPILLRDKALSQKGRSLISVILLKFISMLFSVFNFRRRDT